VALAEPKEVAILEPELLNWMALDVSSNFHGGVVPIAERAIGPRNRLPTEEDLDRLRSLGYVE